MQRACRQSSDTDSEPTQNEVEAGKRLLAELIEREMGASKASSHVNVAYWNEILIHRSNFLDDAIAYCEYDDLSHFDLILFKNIIIIICITTLFVIF